MQDQTIVTTSKVGQHLDKIAEAQPVSYLGFNKQKIKLVAKITIGRDTDNSVVIDNKLASRHHAVIQKVKDEYFVRDENSTNGTFVNDRRIPPGKYVKLSAGDKITIGNATLVMA